MIYNSYLSVINTEKSIDNAYKLGLQTENTYTLAYAIELLFPEADDSKTLEKLNTLNDKLNKSSVAKNYIDYYLIHIALPLNDKEKSINLATANEFNPMNYRLLMHKYYSATDKEGQMQALHKLEKIDPYDNYILFELAKLYEINSMSKELAQVKQRFSDSKRFKTTEEIEFMNSLKIR